MSDTNSQPDIRPKPQPDKRPEPPTDIHPEPQPDLVPDPRPDLRSDIRPNPRPKIAALVLACVVVLGLSIWGLVSGIGAGETPSALQEQGSSGSGVAVSSSSGNSSGTANTPGTSDSTGTDGSPASDSGEGDSDTQGSTATGAGNAGTNATGNGADQGGGGGTQPEPQPAQSITVSLNVSCYEAVAAGSAAALAVSDTGAMRSATLRLDPGSTVYDALVASGAALGSSSGPMGVYVYSIDGLAEKDAGSSSGWKYYVNGSEPTMPCSAYVLGEGDSVEWRYVLQA